MFLGPICCSCSTAGISTHPFPCRCRSPGQSRARLSQLFPSLPVRALPSPRGGSRFYREGKLRHGARSLGQDHQEAKVVPAVELLFPEL